MLDLLWIFWVIALLYGPVVLGVPILLIKETFAAALMFWDVDGVKGVNVCCFTGNDDKPGTGAYVGFLILPNL